MSTQKQIEANRKNARNSTGPKTATGKATVAQNAIKHGLTAQKPLIPGEDPAEFDMHCQLMQDELDPQTPLETILANRIITLSWQLNRGPGIHAAAFNHLIGDLFDPPQDPEARLGEAVVRDFYNNSVLDRIQTYTARIESNLYKTMHQLQKIQQIRQNTPRKNKPNLPPAQDTESRRVALAPPKSRRQNEKTNPISNPPEDTESGRVGLAPPQTQRNSQNKPNPTPNKTFETPCNPTLHLRPAPIQPLV